jgi:hypothetical protein
VSSEVSGGTFRSGCQSQKTRLTIPFLMPVSRDYTDAEDAIDLSDNTSATASSELPIASNATAT